MTTLIIDSTAGTLPRLRSLFEERGLPEVVVARTAAEARAILDEKPAGTDGTHGISLIVIDGKLDDGDGFELCRQIRKLPAAEHAYIIMLVSSIENKTAIDKATHSGADDFAVKPYDGIEFSRHLMMFAHRKTVLLVEDDPVVAQLVSALLQKKHLQAIHVSDGMKAYNLINAIAPSKLAILDIALPGMNGVKLAEHIRSKSSWRLTPVLMLTGSKDAQDVKRSLGAGANDYIVKPFQVADLSKRIDKYLGDPK
ncbi:MAG: two-component system, OmpR family, response regulator VicR [Pseudomonadota bacterium]|nr:two-component system, OmpR family, response regulator VicR [Pseudomonadota bacterium]